MSENRVVVLLVVLILLATAGGAWWGVGYQREQQQQTWQAGHDAGVTGIPVEACPYGLDGWHAQPAEARIWREGWIEGRKAWLKRKGK